VQILTNGGAGSKPKPTSIKDILGIEDSCRCMLENVGVQEADPTQQKPIRVGGARLAPWGSMGAPFRGRGGCGWFRRRLEATVASPTTATTTREDGGD